MLQQQVDIIKKESLPLVFDFEYSKKVSLSRDTRILTRQ